MALSEHQNSSSLGSLDFPKTNKPVETVIHCIEQGLEQFAIEFKGTPIQNEQGLTQELCDILNENAGESSFWFHHQNIQDTTSGRSASTDIGVKSREEMVVHALTIAKRKAFFELEAKRLPTPEKSREKEYVIGNNDRTGGIERFKIAKHGKSVFHAGLIGFVQQNEFDHWHSKINSWISELFDASDFWNPTDQLVVHKIMPSVAIFHSKSKRSSGDSDSITLFHWWVKMN